MKGIFAVIFDLDDTLLRSGKNSSTATRNGKIIV